MHSPRVIAAAIIVDAVAIIAFATAGRITHGEVATPGGVLETAWPFLLGLAAGWFTVLRALESADVTKLFPAGVAVWAWTMVGGIVLRLLTATAIPWPFVLTAAIITAALLLGWRLIARIFIRLRGGRAPRPAASETL